MRSGRRFQFRCARTRLPSAAPIRATARRLRLEPLEPRLLLAIVDNPLAETKPGMTNFRQAIEDLMRNGGGALIFATGDTAIQGEGDLPPMAEIPYPVTVSGTGKFDTGTNPAYPEKGLLILGDNSKLEDLQFADATITLGANAVVDSNVSLETCKVTVGHDSTVGPEVDLKTCSITVGHDSTVTGLQLTGTESDNNNLVLLNSNSTLKDSTIDGGCVAVGDGTTQTTNVIIQGNKIHSKSAGAGYALSINGDHVIVGGGPTERNVIAGVAPWGAINMSPGSHDSQIIGNFIGTIDAGLTSSGGSVGLQIIEQSFESSNVLVSGNIIAGNSAFGILLGRSSGVRIVGNTIGLGANGRPLPNGVGIAANEGFNTIGAPGAGNTIAGNTGDGIYLGTCSDTLVQGNYIGTNPTSSLGLGNGGDGIHLLEVSTANTIGGTNPADANVIVCNGGNGIAIEFGAASTVVQGNFIGTDKTSTPAMGNGKNGILANGDSNTIGTPGAGNIIVDSRENGISIEGNENEVQSNYIGTNSAGDDLGNDGDGISIRGNMNVVGAPVDSNDNSLGNWIAFSGQGQDDPLRGNGVVVVGENSERDCIRLNHIFKNHRLGIDLGNDYFDKFPGDYNETGQLTWTDGGPNKRMWHPTILGVDAKSETIGWMLNAPADGHYTIDIYADPENGRAEYAEGQEWKQTLNPVYQHGHWEFTTHLGVTKITATATDDQGNTSEFSLADEDGDALCDTWEWNGGIDLDGTGHFDALLPRAPGQTAESAILQKDVYVQYDSMAGWAPDGPTLATVVAAFQEHGIKLHLVPGDQYILPTHFGQDPWPVFEGIKQTHFAGGSGSGSDAYQAALLAYRYCIFGVSYGGLNEHGIMENILNRSGLAQILGNDFMVTLGPIWALWNGQRHSDAGSATAPTTEDLLQATPRIVATARQSLAGTFMHELGHTLGLRHNGTENWDQTVPRMNLSGATEILPVEQSVAYDSVMNYRYQGPNFGVYDPPGHWVHGTLHLYYAERAPDEWNNLWFAFQENPHSKRQDLPGCEVDDGPPPDYAALDDLVTLVESTPASPVVVGTPITITASLANQGLAIAAGSMLTLTVAGDATIGTATSSLGTVTVSGNTITASLGDLANLASATVTVTITPTRSGLLQVTAQATSTTNDADTDNNAASATITVSGRDIDNPGLYVPENTAFYLHDRQDSGDAEHVFAYGVAGVGWIELVGDWNGDGQDTPGMYDPATGMWYLTNKFEPGDAEHTFMFGIAGQGWKPLIGDWDGDGRDGIGVYEPATSLFFFKNALAGGDADEAVQFGVGSLGWIPITGDWDGLPGDGFGFYEPAISAFWLKNARTPGPAEECFQFGMGSLGWTVLAGNWDGLPGDGVGFYVPETGQWFLKNAHTPGDAEVSFSYGVGGAGWRPLVGCWSTLPASSPTPDSLLPTPSCAAPPVDRIDLAALAAQQLRSAWDNGDFDFLIGAVDGRGGRKGARRI